MPVFPMARSTHTHMTLIFPNRSALVSTDAIPYPLLSEFRPASTIPKFLRNLTFFSDFVGFHCASYLLLIGIGTKTNVYVRLKM